MTFLFQLSPLPCYSIVAILISIIFCSNTVLQRSFTIHSLYLLDIYSPSCQVWHSIRCLSSSASAGSEMEQGGKGRRVCMDKVLESHRLLDFIRVLQVHSPSIYHVVNNIPVSRSSIANSCSPPINIGARHSCRRCDTAYVTEWKTGNCNCHRKRVNVSPS